MPKTKDFIDTDPELVYLNAALRQVGFNIGLENTDLVRRVTSAVHRKGGSLDLLTISGIQADVEDKWDKIRKDEEGIGE